MVGVFLPTNYKDFPYLRPSKADVVLCEICRMELRHTRIVWLEWGKGESRPSLPGGYSPEDTAGCFPYCTDDAAAVFASGAPPPRHELIGPVPKRGRGRPRAEVSALQVQLWLSGDLATKTRHLCKLRGQTPQELFRKLLERE